MKRNPRIEALLETAIHEQRCAYATNNAESCALSRRYRIGELCKPHPGLYFPTQMWDGFNGLQRTLYVIRALHALHPDWRFAGLSAAAVYGLPVRMDLFDGKIYIAAHTDTPGKSDRMLRRVFATTVEGPEHSGIPVTSVEKNAGRLHETLRVQRCARAV